MIAPWTVALDQSLWACHHRVPSSELKLISWVKFVPAGIGHCVTFSGPSDHGFLGCFTPCLQIYLEVDYLTHTASRLGIYTVKKLMQVVKRTSN